MRSLLVCLLVVIAACTGIADAYIVKIDVPAELQAGVPLLIEGNSTFPVGTQFDIVLYSLRYSTPERVGERVIVVDESKTFDASFATNGLPAGPYKVEVQFYDTMASKLGTGSVTVRSFNLVDRSSEIFLTIPREQTLDWALLIEGYLPDFGVGTIRLKINGPQGFSLPDQNIRTTTDLGRNDGHFSLKVNVTDPGNYYVEFYDSKGYIAQIIYTVTESVANPVTVSATSPETTPATPTPSPTATPRAPFPAAAVIAGIVFTGFLAARKKETV